MAHIQYPKLESRNTSTGNARSASVDADVVFIAQDASKKAVAAKGAYSESVEKLRKSGAFTAKHAGIQFLRFGGKGGAENALLCGLGDPAEVTEEKMRVAGGAIWSRLGAEKCGTAKISLDSLLEARGLKSDTSPARLVRALAEGLVLGAYSWTKHLSKPEKEADRATIQFITADKSLSSAIAKELKEVEAVGEAVTIVRDWSNEPSNIGTPEYYANEAVKLGKKYGLKVKVLSEADAKREGMGMFLGVGQGSEREGKVVIVEYTPKGAQGAKKGKLISLVGKGITFDSGGISIKPSMRMEGMKHDMTGAASVFGATILASLWGVQNRIVTVMGFTENMPSGTAITPSTVLKARNGKTVEVINTDAEGRLILGDLLDLAQDYKPDAVVNAATLTGAVSVALGKHAIGLLGNDDTLIEQLKRAGEKNFERLWQLPLFDEYFEDMKSETADMRNSANDSFGGTIRGAIFLKQFIRKGQAWAHLDIAAISDGITHFSYIPKKGASGIVVRTLAQFVADY